MCSLMQQFIEGIKTHLQGQHFFFFFAKSFTRSTSCDSTYSMCKSPSLSREKPHHRLDFSWGFFFLPSSLISSLFFFYPMSLAVFPPFSPTFLFSISMAHPKSHLSLSLTKSTDDIPTELTLIANY